MSTESYVYILSDGSVPFYVGMGVGDRAYHHVRLRNSQKERNTFKSRKIRKILAEGRDVEYDIIWCESDEEARQLEADLIVKYGRRGIDNNGILTNRAPGGRGGDIMTPEQRAQSAQKRQGYWNRLPDSRRSEIVDKIRSTKIENGSWRTVTDWMTSDTNKQKLADYNASRKQLIERIDDQQNVVLFSSQREAALASGCSQGAISNVLNGRSSRAGGYKWKRVFKPL